MSNWREKLLDMIVSETICTDSDLEDFAHENRVSERDVFHFVAVIHTNGTPCEGCQYIDFRPNMAPCSRCQRAYVDINDFYTPVEN